MLLAFRQFILKSNDKNPFKLTKYRIYEENFTIDNIFNADDNA